MKWLSCTIRYDIDCMALVARLQWWLWLFILLSFGVAVHPFQIWVWKNESSKCLVEVMPVAGAHTAARQERFRPHVLKINRPRTIRYVPPETSGADDCFQLTIRSPRILWITVDFVLQAARGARHLFLFFARHNLLSFMFTEIDYDWKMSDVWCWYYINTFGRPGFWRPADDLVLRTIAFFKNMNTLWT